MSVAPTVAPTPQERSRFGELADDVAYLRRVCGLLVAPFEDGYRIQRDKVDADGLVARATAERARRRTDAPKAAVATSKPAVAAPVAPRVMTKDAHRELHAGIAKAARPTKPATCGCGKPGSHPGRCWFRRGLPDPKLKPPAVDRAVAAREARLGRALAELDSRIDGIQRVIREIVKLLRRGHDVGGQPIAKLEKMVTALN